MNDWKQKPPLGSILNYSSPLAQGLVGLWLFNEGAGGKAYDMSGYNNTGTLTGMANPSTATSGWNSQGLAFDATDDRITVADNPILNPSSITLDAWIYVTDWTIGNTRRSVASNYYPDGTPSGYILLLHTSTTLTIGIANGTSIVEVASSGYAVNKWYNVVGTYNATSGFIGLYVNGRLVNSGSHTSAISYNDYPSNMDFLIGWDYSTGVDRKFVGFIDKIAVYDRAISATEVMQLYQQPYAMVWKPTWTFFDLAAGGTTYYANLSDTVNLAEGLNKSVGLFNSDSIGLTEGLSKSIGVFNIDSVSLAESLNKSIGLFNIDTVGITESLIKRVELLLADTENISDSINSIIAIFVAIADSIGISDSLTKNISINTSDSITILEGIVKSISVGLSDNVAISDILSALLIIPIALSDTVTITDALNKQITIVKSDTVGVTESLIKSVMVSASDTVNITDTIGKLLSLYFSDSLTITDDLETSTVTIVVAPFTITFTVKKPKIDGLIVTKPDIDFTVK